MKKTVFIALAIVLTFMWVFYPPHLGNSQPPSKLPVKIAEPVMTAIQAAHKDIDNARSASIIIDSKLQSIEKKVNTVYRVHRIYIHDTIIVHDTLMDIGTKYIAVPSKDYYFKWMRNYSDSIAGKGHFIEIKHNLFYKIFHKR